MSSGRYINLSDMKKEDIILGDIETSINHIFRFTGHWDKNRPLTVGQHSIMCMRLAEEHGECNDVQLACLTHDFAEAYIGDVSTPLKKIMGNYWKEFAEPIEHLVNEVVSPVGNNPEVKEIVKFYDLMALDIERRCMWNNKGKDKWPDIPMQYGRQRDKEKMFFDVQRYGLNTPVAHNYHRLILNG